MVQKKPHFYLTYCNYLQLLKADQNKIVFGKKISMTLPDLCIACNWVYTNAVNISTVSIYFQLDPEEGAMTPRFTQQRSGLKLLPYYYYFFP